MREHFIIISQREGSEQLTDWEREITEIRLAVIYIWLFYYSFFSLTSKKCVYIKYI